MAEAKEPQDERQRDEDAGVAARAAAPVNAKPPGERPPDSPPGSPPGPPPGAPRTGDPGEQTVLERDPKVQKPRMWKVILHNDDYTTMEFVVWVLESVFAMDIDSAHALMWAIHKHGKGVAGVFTRDIAETKATTVRELAEENGMPLLCTAEPED